MFDRHRSAETGLSAGWLILFLICTAGSTSLAVSIPWSMDLKSSSRVSLHREPRSKAYSDANPSLQLTPAIRDLTEDPSQPATLHIQDDIGLATACVNAVKAHLADRWFLVRESRLPRSGEDPVRVREPRYLSNRRLVRADVNLPHGRRGEMLCWIAVEDGSVTDLSIELREQPPDTLPQGP